MTPYVIVACALTFLSVWWGEKWVIQYCLRNDIVDIPNDRSLHGQPIPRGGGIGVLLPIGVMLALFSGIGWIELPWAFVVGSLILFTISIFEDYERVPIKIRLPVQVLATCLVIFNMEGLQYLPLPEPFNVKLGMWSFPVHFIWILGLTNFFNFMDGIDGLAALQAAIGGILLGIVGGGGFPLIIGLLIASASLGFLRWNWQPAQIFLGETGAITLGFIFATLPFYSQGVDLFKGVLFTGLFFWLFLADGAFTLFRRLLKGEKIWEPHRSHLYQRLVLSGLSHPQVVIGLMAGQLVIGGLTILCLFQKFSLWYPFMAALLFFGAYWGITVFREKQASKN